MSERVYLVSVFNVEFSYTQRRVQQLTRIDWFSLNSSSPATTMFPSWNFEKLGSDHDIVIPVFDNLNTPSLWVVFSPSI